jgi:hypothetical protein
MTLEACVSHSDDRFFVFGFALSEQHSCPYTQKTLQSAPQSVHSPWGRRHRQRAAVANLAISICTLQTSPFEW